jgi:predicted Zn finger-like uncharacterized protein
MRLICPNCDAEYEVDATAIPDAGRDVQCSNCGHAWFQGPPETEAVDLPVDEPAEVEPDDPTLILEEAPDDPVAPLVVDTPQPRSVDDSVMAILKEEAEFELAARRAEAIPVETQPDLGLDAGPVGTVAQQIAALKGAEDVVEPAKQTTRRELLPDIEEINSTLRPSSAVRYDEDDDAPMMLPTPQARSGFRSGFVLMLLLAAVLVAVYLMAPRLAQQMPGAKGALESYVAGVDQARIGLDSATKSVIGALRRLAGSE